MKIRLTSFYGDKNPGDIVDCDDKEGARVLSVGGAVAYVPSEDEANAPAAKKPVKP